jgi:hypothetical protein
VKATFAEQVSGLTSSHARRRPGLTCLLQAIALALGGRAGARLSGRLAAGVSRMTLIWLIRALPDPAVSRVPRVLGVDELVRTATRSPVRDPAGGCRDPPPGEHLAGAVG